MQTKAILACALAWVVAGAAAALTQSSAERGRALFLRDGCYECHGTVGQGAVTAPRLAPNPPDAAAISAYIRHPAGQMPPYSPKVISDDQIADIHAYLASVKPPPGPAGSSRSPGQR
jgi:ubiquinol-cytochrome c reductase cytochrome c subunit